MAKKGRITGIGGIFFKSDNPDKMRAWYNKTFALNSDQHGHSFTWKKKEDPQRNGYTVWNIFDAKTDYFKPSTQQYMINYRVENLEELLIEMKQEGVEIVGEMEEYEYGKFAWALDPDGNKMELWEPVDSVFDDYNEKKENA